MFFDIHGNSDSDCDDDYGLSSVVEPYSIVGDSVLVPIRKTKSEIQRETDKENDNVAANKQNQSPSGSEIDKNESKKKVVRFHERKESQTGIDKTNEIASNEVPVSGLVKRMFNTVDPKTKTDFEDHNSRSSMNSNTRTNGKCHNQKHKHTEETRIKELEQEIEKFKQISLQLEKEKEKVSQSLAKMSKMQEQSTRQQNEFNKTYKLKREEFEEWMNGEREKIEKERSNIERQKRRLQALQTDTMADRKDRSEIESLKASIAKMKLEKREYTNRMKGIMQHKEMRLKDLEQQVLELEETLQFAEKRRIDAWDKESEMKRMVDQKESTIILLQQQVNQLQLKLQNIQHQRKNSAINKQTQTQIKTKPAEDQENKTDDNNVRSKLHKSDVKVKIFPDGSKLLTFPNGSTKEIFKDYSITRYENGDTEKITNLTNGENKVEYFYKKENTTVISYNIVKKV